MKNYKLKNPQATGDNLDDSSKMNLTNRDDDENEYNDNQFDEINALKSLLAIMQPTESVVRAIKRLGASATR